MDETTLLHGVERALHDDDRTAALQLVAQYGREQLEAGYRASERRYLTAIVVAGRASRFSNVDHLMRHGLREATQIVDAIYRITEQAP